MSSLCFGSSFGISDKDSDKDSVGQATI